MIEFSRRSSVHWPELFSDNICPPFPNSRMDDEGRLDVFTPRLFRKARSILYMPASFTESRNQFPVASTEFAAYCRCDFTAARVSSSIDGRSRNFLNSVSGIAAKIRFLRQSIKEVFSFTRIKK